MAPDFSQELTVAKVMEWLMADVVPVAPETVPLAQALGRVLAVSVKAGSDQPPFPSAAMDGWAVRSADLTDAAPSAPCVLHNIGEIPAGHPLNRALDAGETARIFTGATLPVGADAVVRQEDVSLRGDDPCFTAPIAAGRYVRPPGREFTAGTELLSPGSRLNALGVGLAASADYSALTVYRRPRIGILATGDEIVPPGAARRPGQIVSSNAYAIAALARRWGGEPVPLGIAADTPEALMAKLEQAAGLDLVVTIGGTAAGRYDVVAASGLQAIKVALRPCKSIVAGRLAGVRVLGLPGNPVPAALGAVTFLAPMLRALSGLRAAPCRQLPAELLGDLPASGLCRNLYLARLTRTGGVLVAEVLGGPMSGGPALALARADGVIIRYPGLPLAGDGDPVDVLTFDDAAGPD